MIAVRVQAKRLEPHIPHSIRQSRILNHTYVQSLSLSRDEQSKLSQRLNLMLEGWTIHRWRRTSPHNWFFVSPDGKDVENLDLRQDRTINLIRTMCSKPQMIKEDGYVVQYWGSDSGKSAHEFYGISTETGAYRKLTAWCK